MAQGCGGCVRSMRNQPLSVCVCGGRHQVMCPVRGFLDLHPGSLPWPLPSIAGSQPHFIRAHAERVLIPAMAEALVTQGGPSGNPQGRPVSAGAARGPGTSCPWLVGASQALPRGTPDAIGGLG